MASTLTSLDAASNDRKARLAQLKSLKRKRPENTEQAAPADEEIQDAPQPSYLSGRNYDAATRGPKLGFEHQPNKDQVTLEQQAAEIESTARKEAEEEAKADQPIDLFKLQPKKPNWDLKRDVERKLERLNVQTDNAIARIVRARIAAQKERAGGDKGGDGADGAAGIDGGELLESVHQREREAEADAQEEDQDEEEV